MIRRPILLCAALVLTCNAVAQAPGAGGPPPSPVSVVSVERTTIVPTVPVAGTLYSRNDVQITAGIDGRLLEVAEPGQRVAIGDIVARIDSGPLQLQIDEQKALASRAQAQLKFLTSQFERQQRLGSALSQDQLEQTAANRDVAMSDLRVAEVRSAQISDQIARCVMRANFPGVIVQRMHRVGEDVARGTVLARLTDTEQVEVRVFVPLKYSKRVAVDDTLRLFGFESDYTGQIRAIIPAADQRSQTFEARIDVPAAALQEWSIGQLVSVAIPVQAPTETLAVPRDALILRQNGTFVFRIKADNTAERVAVEIGDSAGEMVAVSGRLTLGDRVAIRGAETLRDGATVQVLGDPARTANNDG